MFDHQLKIRPKGREPQDKRDSFILWPYSPRMYAQQSIGNRRGNNAYQCLLLAKPSTHKNMVQVCMVGMQGRLTFVEFGAAYY